MSSLFHHHYVHSNSKITYQMPNASTCWISALRLHYRYVSVCQCDHGITLTIMFSSALFPPHRPRNRCQRHWWPLSSSEHVLFFTCQGLTENITSGLDRTIPEPLSLMLNWYVIIDPHILCFILTQCYVDDPSSEPVKSLFTPIKSFLKWSCYPTCPFSILETYVISRNRTWSISVVTPQANQAPHPMSCRRTLFIPYVRQFLSS